ncbi:ABC transporter permease [Mesorhizobium sp. YM1C-6-2]|uniref:ABC transporter permease n=1 Tax=Mesorhizobium sp. YM1C-6-2 TaxID=1827501 RepID=UPI000EF19603|nr:ABC transporter permease [Mesorhizobium sp. YM1C-6-2]RLP26984.1 ABC transporter permease [Mesorhizobium sp. YM1C-6-2]
MTAVEQQVPDLTSQENRFGIKPKRAGGADERLAAANWFTKLLRRPEAGAAGGLVATIVIFALLPGAANLYSLQGAMTFLTLSAELGIIATATALLIIAGEFDLSIGSMIGFAGVVIGLTVRELGFPLWGGIASAFAVAVLVGYLNGLIVVRTRLPSFIVTLASLFILRGLSIAITRAVTGRTQIPYILDDVPDPATAGLFNGHVFTGFFRWMAAQGWIAARSDGIPFVTGIPASIVWWLAITAAAGYVLTQTRYGNWIFATGGDQEVARNVGVPVGRVKISLFICTACAATLLATIQVMEAGSADTTRGLLKEFEAIIAAVIGGVLLTGGYGTVYGVLFGSLIFGLVQMGIFYTGIDTDWFKVFLGLVILAAVLVNTYIRTKALGGGRSR